MNKKESQALGVLGAGSWGTALALLTARAGRTVRLWSHHQTGPRIRSLGGLPLPDNVQVTSRFEELIEHNTDFVVAVPSHGFRPVLERFSQHLGAFSDSPRICWGTKGFEPDSGLLLSEVFDQVLGDAAVPAVLSGPSFAAEVAQRLPTALTTAARTLETADAFADWFRDERTRVYTSTDLPGVQLGGAIKNVIAIAAGISDGLGFGANTRAALITRGLAEMSRLGRSLGGQAETFMGLTGMGDLILTCTDDQSRNRRVGLAIAAGKPIDAVLAEIGQEAEGVNTTRVLYQKSTDDAVSLPITEQVYRVLFEGLEPAAAVTALLAREPRPEKN